MSFRIGQGFDVHAFGPGNHVVIGGVKIPYERGLEAHSDGDVLLHALADALLGALALGDIGHHFPEMDARYANVDSRRLLRQVVTLINHKGYRLVNADITLIAQAPKMAPYVEAMRTTIAADCGVERGDISVKATTTERLGFPGRGEGIAAQAVVLLEHSHD
ncbi:2-C-methyl-D-erythritol 2,4-cyclodiphosphate synthase [Microbulbifer sp. 2205BS26-8]|uniref:2-C-methyl-D-erythritol 2,4-cyclodiphosphate synthase n=1 Tax=Microbulbifer sp. 2205BS26-8 TaxID=3064386 RepID=UPI00273D52A7|nr:2-C-methyl-D-erythritol 2,4-cyclodiphosphate synthase [Microbulbifer sp. 2205BS26-8]MDP5209313.1 2-C-methyl-D-erythritol 2,4-cyclodiphosphate synthase [Microbulbifer sp. 2205BS26-8]